MKLVIVHYHLRPGGIRRIIELATPYLIRALDRTIESVLLATGEALDRKWNKLLEAHLAPTPLDFFVEPTFNYLSEQTLSPRVLSRQVRDGVTRLLGQDGPESALVWAHNLGIGRNPVLARELARICEVRNISMMSHHHDWWFENRWLRWPEMRRFGFRTLATTAQTIFPPAAVVRHIAINHSDAAPLQRHFGQRAGWLPNLSERAVQPSSDRIEATREWLRHKLADHEAPVWLLPCRLLRRKNVAEALLLTRWLRPEAWLVTTGGVSSADEQPYAEKLSASARRHHWRLRLGVLAGDEMRKPSVEELLAASECVMLTSIQEGFGLPYLEAAAADRPLVARALSNIAGDLDKFGFRFPHGYSEILVAPGLFDWDAEQRRQFNLFTAWKRYLPRACRRWVGHPLLLAAGDRRAPVPFSRLTLTAQLEVLSHPAGESWERCQPLNPFLAAWRPQAAAGRLETTRWPRQAEAWLSGPAYGQRFAEILQAKESQRLSPDRARTAQEDFMQWKLSAEHLFPLLWSKDT